MNKTWMHALSLSVALVGCSDTDERVARTAGDAAASPSPVLGTDAGLATPSNVLTDASVPSSAAIDGGSAPVVSVPADSSTTPSTVPAVPVASAPVSTASGPGSPVTGSASRIVGNGKLVTEERVVDAFDGLRLSGVFSTELSVGSHAVSLFMDENIIPQVDIHTTAHLLYVAQRDPSIELRPSDKARVRVAAPELASVEATGQTDLTGTTKATSLAIRASDQATVGLAVANTGKLTLVGEMQGDLKVSGTSSAVVVTASDQANVDCTISAESVDVTASGEADVTVHATKKVRVRASDSANVTILGNPTERDVMFADEADVSYDDD